MLRWPLWTTWSFSIIGNPEKTFEGYNQRKKGAYRIDQDDRRQTDDDMEVTDARAHRVKRNRIEKRLTIKYAI